MAKPRYRYPTGFRHYILTIRDGGHCRVGLPRCKHTGPSCPGCAEELDHINPDGAWFSPENCRASCHNCNYDRRRRYAPPPPTTIREHW